MRFDADYRTITLSSRNYHCGPRLHTRMLLALLTIWNAILAPVRKIAIINHARMTVLAWAVGVLAMRTIPFILETIAAGYIEKAIGV